MIWPQVILKKQRGPWIEVSAYIINEELVLPSVLFQYTRFWLGFYYLKN